MEVKKTVTHGLGHSALKELSLEPGLEIICKYETAPAVMYKGTETG